MFSNSRYGGSWCSLCNKEFGGSTIEELKGHLRRDCKIVINITTKDRPRYRRAIIQHGLDEYRGMATLPPNGSKLPSEVENEGKAFLKKCGVPIGRACWGARLEVKHSQRREVEEYVTVAPCWAMSLLELFPVKGSACEILLRFGMLSEKALSIMSALWYATDGSYEPLATGERRAAFSLLANEISQPRGGKQVQGECPFILNKHAYEIAEVDHV